MLVRTVKQNEILVRDGHKKIEDGYRHQSQVFSVLSLTEQDKRSYFLV